MRYTIDQKIIQAVIDYLVTKPYKEVAGLIAEIQKDVKVVTDVGKDKSTETKGEKDHD